jgi:hypothetical protein
MMDKVYLIGTEEVTWASHRMQDAANQISRAVESLDAIMLQQRIAMESFVSRLEALEMNNGNEP